MARFEVGDKVKIVKCALYPRNVGKIGKIEKFVNDRLFKVSLNGVDIPHFAVDDCLEKVEE